LAMRRGTFAHQMALRTRLEFRTDRIGVSRHKIIFGFHVMLVAVREIN